MPITFLIAIPPAVAVLFDARAARRRPDASADHARKQKARPRRDQEGNELDYLAACGQTSSGNGRSGLWRFATRSVAACHERPIRGTCQASKYTRNRAAGPTEFGTRIAL